MCKEKQKVGGGGEWARNPYGSGAAGFATGGADEIEDGFCRFREVGVFGEFRMLLRLLHALEEGAAIAAAKREPCHLQRGSNRDGDPLVWPLEQEINRYLICKFLKNLYHCLILNRKIASLCKPVCTFPNAYNFVVGSMP